MLRQAEHVPVGAERDRLRQRGLVQRWRRPTRVPLRTQAGPRGRDVQQLPGQEPGVHALQCVRHLRPQRQLHRHPQPQGTLPSESFSPNLHLIANRNVCISDDAQAPIHDFSICAYVYR